MLGRKAVSPVVGSIILITIVIISVASIAISMNEINDEMPTELPAGVKINFEETPEGMLAEPTNLRNPVTIQLNNNPITKIEPDDVGKEIFLPTSTGDTLIVTSSTGTGKILLKKKIHKGEAGDFIAHYKFNSGNGDNVIDRSGNKNTGQIQENPTWITENETGLQFDGSSYVGIDDISAPIDVEEFTVAVAYRQRERGSHDVSQLIEHTWSGNEWFLETRVDGSDSYRIEYAVGFPDDQGDIETGYDYKLGERHVAVGTYDGNEFKLYVDGKLEASGSFQREVDMGDMKIARDFESDIQYFVGDIYEVRLYYTTFDEQRVDILSEVMSGG